MSNWPRKPLSELAEIRASNVDKKTISGECPVRLCNYMNVYSNEYITNNLDFMDATASVAEIQRFRVERGDVLITKDSETPDDIGIPSVVIENIDNLVCGYHVSLIKPYKSIVDPVYLAKQLAFIETAMYFGTLANGSTRYGLSYQSIANTLIRVAPLPQQRRIAEILSTVDEAIEQTEALIAKTQQIKAGLMHDLFTRGVTPDGKLRPPREEAPELYKESELGWIPKEWDIFHIDESAVTIIDGDRGENYPQSYELLVAGYCLFLSATNVTKRGFVFDVLQFISKDKDAILRAGKLEKGDIVLTTRGTVGNIAHYNDEVLFPNVRINSGMAILRSNHENLNIEFLYYSLQNHIFEKEYKRVISGSAQPQLPVRDLKKFNLIRPSPNEQKNINRQVVAIFNVLQSYQKGLVKLRQTKCGIMHDLLSGKVLVPTREKADV